LGGVDVPDFGGVVDFFLGENETGDAENEDGD
jgi:hypothetical protein